MDHLKRLLERYPALVELKNEISESYELMKKKLRKRRKAAGLREWRECSGF